MSKTYESLPIPYDIVVYRGDGYTRDFSLFFGDDEDPPWLDATGWTGRMHVRDEVDGNIFLTASTDNGRLTTGYLTEDDPPAFLRLHLTPGDTAILPAGFVGVYDIELTDLSGRRKTFYHRKFCVEGDITHD